MEDRREREKKNEWVGEGKQLLNESYLSENRAPISSVQASDTLLRDGTFSQTHLLQPQTNT